MRILFDQGAPAPLRYELPDHEITTAYEAGLSNVSNGDLLAAIDSSFDVLLPTDKNLRYQQNLLHRKITIVVLPTTSWPCIKQHVAEVVEALRTLRPADYVEIEFAEKTR